MMSAVEKKIKPGRATKYVLEVDVVLILNMKLNVSHTEKVTYE